MHSASILGFVAISTNLLSMLGPYAPAILRFQISFPLAYPILPPLITFSTDLFHPLIAPLTTYIQDSGTVSAPDDERLPPGGFSLRHGFPSWFGRAGRSAASGQQPSVQHLQTPRKSSGGSTSGRDTPESVTSSSPTPADTRQERIFTYEVLKYIRSTFDNAEVLDMVPLEAAGNPGAWHAWRTYRLKSGNVLPPLPKETKSPSHGELSGSESDSATSEGYQRLAGGTSSPSMPRRPGEWNWDGVWEVRAKKGIDSSISEPVLYGNLASNDELASAPLVFFCDC